MGCALHIRNTPWVSMLGRCYRVRQCEATEWGKAKHCRVRLKTNVTIRNSLGDIRGLDYTSK